MYQVIEELKNQPSSTITVSDNNDGYWYFYDLEIGSMWLSEMENIPEKFARVINDNFWEIL